MIKRADIITTFGDVVSSHLPGLKPTVRLNGQSSTMLGVTWSDMEVVLTYAPRFLRVCTSAEHLRVALLHEVCHPLSAPSARITLPVFPSEVATSCCVAYLDLFREFIAHQEFLRRFPDEAGVFEQWELRAFQPKVLGTRTPMVSEDSYFLHFGKMFGVFYDAIFLELIGNQFFVSWCAAHRKWAIYQLFGYIMEDIAHIVGRDVGYEAKMQLMVDSFKLAVNVAVDGLESDRLALLAPVEERAGRLKLDPQITGLWVARNIATAVGS